MLFFAFSIIHLNNTGLFLGRISSTRSEILFRILLFGRIMKAVKFPEHGLDFPASISNVKFFGRKNFLYRRDITKRARHRSQPMHLALLRTGAIPRRSPVSASTGSVERAVIQLNGSDSVHSYFTACPSQDDNHV